MQKCMDLNKNRPRSLYWPSIIYHSFNFELLSHSIALRSELVVHGYPSLSWTWGALALSCLVCAGLGRIRFGVPKPGLGVSQSVLDMGLSDHRLSGQEHGVPGVVLDLGFTRLSLGGPGSVLDQESARLGLISHRNNLLSIIFLIYLFPEKHIGVARLTI